MKQNTSLIKTIAPLLLTFFIVQLVLFTTHLKLATHNINPMVVLCANALLFFISTLCVALHFKAMKKPNPNALVRSIMLASIIKLLALAIAVFIYVFAAGKNRNVYGIFCGMLLYIIYTFVEVKIAMKLNSSNGNK